MDVVLDGCTLEYMNEYMHMYNGTYQTQRVCCTVLYISCKAMTAKGNAKARMQKCEESESVRSQKNAAEKKAFGGAGIYSYMYCTCTVTEHVEGTVQNYSE